MGFTANVVDGNPILAAWGNEIRDRTLQVFATVAERDQQWPAASAPAGAHCVTVDTMTRWQIKSGAWVNTTPVQSLGRMTFTGPSGSIGTGTGPTKIPNFVLTLTAAQVGAGIPVRFDGWAQIDASVATTAIQMQIAVVGNSTGPVVGSYDWRYNPTVGVRSTVPFTMWANCTPDQYFFRLTLSNITPAGTTVLVSGGQMMADSLYP